LRGVPRQLGDYTILREVDRGGMGVVYEAVQQSLGRHVALKVLPWAAVGAASHLERFQLEARSAARLHHTNIVPVFGVGEAEGVHYYAMQFIHGQGLDAVIDELRRLEGGEGCGPDASGEPGATRTIAATVARSLIGGRLAGRDAAGDAATLAGPAGADPAAADAGSPSGDRASALMSQTELTGAHDRRYYRQVARLALQVAEGLAYAHGQGVLHRDIKPSNLMVDTRGTVWITDFGLAKAEGSDGPTRTGDIVGTLRYMAPERFEGHSDRRSDVYGLGATLYELLTLRPLFGEVNRAKLVDRILHEPPTAPRRLDRHIPKDLETIVLKALAKEPAHRYGDAEAVAADLRRFIDDRPILTRRVSTSEQVWRWCRRNPAVAGLLAFVLLLLIGGAVVGGLAANHFRNLASAEAAARGRADSLARTEREAKVLASRRAAEAQAAHLEADAKAREAQAVTDFLVTDIIGAAAPGKGQGTTMTIGEALARADATIDGRFAGQPLLAATIHYQMALTYFNLKELEKAERHARAAAELRARHLGPDARETLVAQQRLVVALRQLDTWEEARRLGEDLLERQRRVLGPEDPDTLVTMGEIGSLLFPFSDERAPEFYRRLHEALARVKGPEEIGTVNALQWYALSLLARGDHDRAIELLRQALELRIRGSGEGATATFWTMTSLVSALVFEARKYDIAWTDAERFWPLMARGLDPNHYELRATTDSILTLAAATSDWSRAGSLFRREEKALAADLGPGHIRTLHARALLARALVQGGRADEAVAIAGEVIEGAIGRDGEPAIEVVLDHATAAIQGAGVAGPVSRELVRKFQARAEQLVGSGKPKEVVAPLVLAIRLGADGARIDDAVRRIGAEAGARDRLYQAFIDRGAALDRLRALDGAIAAYRTAIRLVPGRADAHDRLAFALERRRDLDGAMAGYREAARLDPKHPYARFGIGRILSRQGSPAAAIAAYREALKLKPDLWDVYPFLARLDPTAMQAVDWNAGLPPMIRNNVAWFLVTSDAPPDPRSVALAVRLARAVVKEQPRAGTYRNTLGVALYRSGDLPGAIAELEESARLLGDERPFGFNGFFLAMAHWRSGDDAKALAYFDRSVLSMEGYARSKRELIRFRAEAEAVVRLDPIFPADPFAP
jgi:serine/threonine protein kinase/tetratricopeptide (TPR) repeat protein